MITELEVETVLAEYHTSYTDEDGNPISVGYPDGRHVIVVVSRGSSPPHVVTVWD